MTQSPSKSKSHSPTQEDTMGPYYPIPFCSQDTVDISEFHPGIVCKPQGAKIILKGRVLDRHGMLAKGVLLEFWQANAQGVYRTPKTEASSGVDPWFSGHTRIRASEGVFSLKTIMPGRSGNASAQRAPNITLTIFSDGIVRVVTQIFFEDEASNQTDPLLMALPAQVRPRLIASFDGQTADCRVYAIDIIMAGENETPFFDDLLS